MVRPAVVVVLTGTLVLSALLAGCLDVRDVIVGTAGEWVEVSLPAGDAPEYHVVEVANARGIAYIGSFNLTVSYGSHPWMILFVHPNGTVDVISHWMFDNAHYGQGAGVAYVSVDGDGMRSPSVVNAPLRLVNAWATHTNATRGHFVFAWTGFPEPGAFRFELAPGTTVREVAAGTVAWYDLANFTRGVSAGIAFGVGGGASLGVDLTPSPGRQTVGLVATYSNDGAFGNATVRLSDGVHELPFNGLCTIGCQRVIIRSALFVTDGPADVSVDWVGSHRNTRVVVVQVELPEPLLPELVHIFEPET